jgi:hypothetical protein
VYLLLLQDVRYVDVLLLCCLLGLLFVSAFWWIVQLKHIEAHPLLRRQDLADHQLLVRVASSDIRHGLRSFHIDVSVLILIIVSCNFFLVVQQPNVASGQSLLFLQIVRQPMLQKVFRILSKFNFVEESLLLFLPSLNFLCCFLNRLKGLPSAFLDVITLIVVSQRVQISFHPWSLFIYGRSCGDLGRGATSPAF